MHECAFIVNRKLERRTQCQGHQLVGFADRNLAQGITINRNALICVLHAAVSEHAQLTNS